MREVTVQQALPQQPALPGDALRPAPPPGVPSARRQAPHSSERAFRPSSTAGSRRDRCLRERARGLARLPQRRRDRRLSGEVEATADPLDDFGLGCNRSNHPDPIFLGHAGSAARQLPRARHDLPVSDLSDGQARPVPPANAAEQEKNGGGGAAADPLAKGLIRPSSGSGLRRAAHSACAPCT